MNTDKAFNADELSRLLVESILAAGKFDKQSLLAIITALIQSHVARDLVPKNYNAYLSKKKKEKWKLALNQMECEREYWKGIVKNIDPENLQNYYEEINRILVEKNLLPKKSTITCYYCERSMDAACFGGEIGIHCTEDHVIPKSKFGKSGHNNLVNACNECNWLKADMTLLQFIKKLEKMILHSTPFMTIPIDRYPVIIKNVKLLQNNTE